MRFIVAHESVDERLAGDELHRRVERGAHRQPAFIELRRAIAIGKLPTHFLGEEARGDIVGRDVAQVEMDVLGLRLLDIRPGGEAVLRHAVEHPITPVDRRVVPFEGIVVARCLRQGCKISGLRERQLVHGFAVIVERGGSDAVIAEAEINLVEIELEDLLFRVGRLDAQREQHLLDLAVVGLLRGQQEILRDLLGDGRGALLPAALTREIGDDGARDAFGVDTVMREEILVLGREEGIDHELRHVLDRQIEAPLLGIFGDQAAVGRVHARHHRRLVIAKLRIVGQVLGVMPDQERRSRGPHHEDDRRGGKEKSEKSDD